MSRNWVNVTAAADKQRLNELENWFWEMGAVSVTMEDAQDLPIFEPPPGEQPLWDQMLVTGLFQSDVSVERLTDSLSGENFVLNRIEELADRAWEREWLNRFEPMCFGDRLWVCPTGFDIDRQGKVVIDLDPGLAFGTGTHETTRLCLEYLDASAVSGLTVVDYGCGSGILGIAACKLGARTVCCVDRDTQALTATRGNAARNGVTVETHLPGVALPSADLVLANILAQPLIELSGPLVAATASGGRLVLSGIMESQADKVSNAYKDRLEPVSRTLLNGWVRLVWRKP